MFLQNKTSNSQFVEEFIVNGNFAKIDTSRMIELIAEEVYQREAVETGGRHKPKVKGGKSGKSILA